MGEKTTILLLEDDIGLVEGLEYALMKEGFVVTVSRTVQEALHAFATQTFDMLLLDLTLPDGSGFDVLKFVRRTSNVPVVFLTASDEEVHVVMGLDMGGDDYITKPFKLNELLSRIKAILRRSQNTVGGTSESTLNCGAIRMNLLSGKTTVNGKEVELTAAEFRLLLFFLQNRNMVLSREVLLNRLWDDGGDFVDDNTLSVYVKRLRNKIEMDPANPSCIQTVRGIGYKCIDKTTF